MSQDKGDAVPARATGLRPQPATQSSQSSVPIAGPWKASKYCGREDSWFVRGPNDERICGQGAGRVTGANARLIAAAPALVEALQEAIALLDDCEISHPLRWETALTLALGEQS